MTGTLGGGDLVGDQIGLGRQGQPAVEMELVDQPQAVIRSSAFWAQNSAETLWSRASAAIRVLRLRIGRPASSLASRVLAAIVAGVGEGLADHGRRPHPRRRALAFVGLLGHLAQVEQAATAETGRPSIRLSMPCVRKTPVRPAITLARPGQAWTTVTPCSSRNRNSGSYGLKASSTRRSA